MEKNTNRMMQMIRSEIAGTPLPDGLFDGASGQDWNHLLSLSKHHDVAHLLGDLIARDELPLPQNVKNAFDEVFCEAVLRTQMLEEELQRIKTLFSREKIAYLPLKGAVIRCLYPESWMRTSCDIDILIHRENVKKAKELLLHKCGYRLVKTPVYHEVSLYSPSGVHLELHFSIEEHTEQLDVVLRRSWDYAEPTKGNPLEYQFQSAFLLFYSVAHAAYHFKGGGCGVRPLIDQYLLEQKVEYDRKIYDDLIRKANLSAFEESFTHLCRVWFAGAEHTELTRRMEGYLLSGGVYGSVEQRETMRLIRHHGKFGNLMHRIWLPYADLITKYPSLEGKRILQPLYEIRRWFSLLNPKRFKRVTGEVKTNFGVDSEQKTKTYDLMHDLKLL